MGFKTDHTNTQKSLKKKKVSWRNSGIYINIKQVNSTVSHNMKNWEVGGGGNILENYYPTDSQSGNKSYSRSCSADIIIT